MHFPVLPHRPGKAVALVVAVLGCALGSGMSVAQPQEYPPAFQRH